jgi:FkbM family methyltransferase
MGVVSMIPNAERQARADKIRAQHVAQQKPAIRVRNGMYWPAFDHNPEGGYRELMKGIGAVDVLVSLCDTKRVVFQAGGHVGLWPMRLARAFKTVYTFEPTPATYLCLKRNTVNTRNIVHMGSALGATVGVAKMRPTQSVGTWRVDDKEGYFEVPQTTIDAAQCREVDAIVLDIEGFEVEALKGAAETIAACHPIILVEELPRAADGIRTHMRDLGYKLVREFGRDRIYEFVGNRQ